MGDVYTNPPQSRNEAILRATIDGTEYTAPPQSRIEDLLLELKEAIEQGGGAGGMSKDTYDPDDAVATAGGIAAYVDDEITDLHLGTASTKNSTSVVTESSDLVESGAVKDIVGWGNKNVNGTKYSDTTSVGVDFTVNSDGSISISGSNTSQGSDSYCNRIPFTFDRENGLYKLNGGYSGAIYLYVFCITDNDRAWADASKTERQTGNSNGTNEPVVYLEKGKQYTVIPRVGKNSGAVPENAKLYPMLRKADDTDGTYEPYHESVEQTLRNAEVVEGKNLLPLTLDSIKALNVSNWSWNGNVGSNNGVDFTISTDSNGYVTKIRANGTATGGNANLHIINSKSYGDIILNGCPSGGSATGYYIRASVSSEYLSDYGSGVEITSTIWDAWIGIVLNKQVTNLDFYPMIRKATESDPTYEPYYVPLKDVVPNKCDNSIIGTVEGANASKAWSVGEHFISGGQFKEVTQPIATGGAISDSNTVNKPIAELINSSFKLGATITSTDDLNNIFNIGFYIITSSPTNAPAGANYASMLILPRSTASGRVQIIIYDRNIYLRAYGGSPSAWDAWKKIESTVIS